VAATTAADGFGLRWRALGSSIAPTQPFFGGIAASAASRLAALLAAARFAASRSAFAFACARLPARTGVVRRRASWPLHTW